MNTEEELESELIETELREALNRRATFEEMEEFLQKKQDERDRRSIKAQEEWLCHAELTNAFNNRLVSSNERIAVALEQIARILVDWHG